MKLGPARADLLLMLQVLTLVATNAACPGQRAMESACGSARRATVGDCLVCLAQKPTFAGCDESARDEFCSAGSALEDINRRFASAMASSNLSSAGVIIHQFDGIDGSAGEQPAQVWLPCPKSAWGKPTWCAKFSDRESCSIIGAKSPPQPDGAIGIFQSAAGVVTGGFVLAPRHTTLLCSYPGDGGTMTRVCLDEKGQPLHPGQRCVPGCECQDTAPRPCNNSCAAPPPSPPIPHHQCAWAAPDLSQMLEQWYGGHGGGAYNELVIDTTGYVANLPASIEAIFYPTGCGAPCENSKVTSDAKAAHMAFQKQYGAQLSIRV
eukprot:SAG11_NODE_1334_length_5178_cov_10.938374_3_plen_321_part_00